MRVRQLIGATALAITMGAGPVLASDEGTRTLPGFCPRLALAISYLTTQYPDNKLIVAIVGFLNTVYQNNCVQ